MRVTKLLSKSIKFQSVKLPATVILLCALAACKTGFESGGNGGSDGNGGGTDNKVTFIGPGHWQIELDKQSDSFTVERRAKPSADVDVTITGNFQQFDNGFTRLTTENISDASATQFNNVFSAIQISDQYLLLLPIENSSDQIIATVAASECPKSNLTGNWITYGAATTADASSESQDYFGTYTYTVNGGIGLLNSRYDLETFTVDETTTLEGTPCDDGISETETAVQYVSSSSTALVQKIAGDASELLFVMDTKEFVTKAQLDSEDYVGFYYDSTFAPGAKASAVSLSCEAGECDMNGVANIETGETNGNSYQISFETPGTLSDAVVDGFVNGTITDVDDNEGKLVCSVDINFLESNKIMWACVGQSPTDSAALVNLFVVSK